MDIVIEEFFNDRKAKSIKKNIVPGMTDLEIQNMQLKIEDEFSLNNWLFDAANRAGQISLSSHPCTFSHPSARKNKNAKTSSIIAASITNTDGFLRSGNVPAELDALGNAAALDVHKFLMLELSDGQKVIDHIEQDTPVAISLLKISAASYEELKAGFIAIKEGDTASVTSSKIKQIYFPVAKNYHQLSILTPSGVLYTVRNRIQNIRFGEAITLARDARKKNEESMTGFDDIYDLLVLGYGGTKPQNISVLNNQNSGKSYLLPSLPPSLKPEEIRLPTFDFFNNCLWPNQFRLSFQQLHTLLVNGRNNIQVRTSRDDIFIDIFNDIVQKIWQIRSTNEGWSLLERFERLPQTQKIILDNHWQDERHNDAQHLNLFLKELARWIILAYKKVLGEKALPLNDDELRYINLLIEEHKEALL